MTVSFLGADHKCGCSMTALCVSQALAMEYQQKNVVLVKGCAGPAKGLPGGGESVERLRPFLAGKNADMDEIFEKSRVKDNFHVISGFDTPGLTATVHPEMSVYLAERLKSRFDFVICDCGCDIEQGLPLGLLLASDSVFMVLDQHDAAVKRIGWLSPLYRRLELPVKGWILCKNSSKALYTPADIEALLGLARGSMITVRNTDRSEEAEADGRSLLSNKDRGYRKDITAIAAMIMSAESEKEAFDGKL